MNPVTACPSRQDLESLLQGQVGFAQAEQLAQHLETCPACVRTIQSLKVDDTLAELIRKQAAHPSHAPDPVLQKVMERLRSARNSGETAGLSRTGGGAPSDDPESYDFLAPAQSADELGRLGSYRILRVLGAGGMGVVFEAEDPQLKRKVALKAMKPALAASATAKQRFVREAQSTAAMKHDHIVTIYQVGEDRGVPFLAMEFLEGAALDSWLKKGRQPTLAQTLRIGREMARGLAAAHDRGLIHRDIKPANVWLEAPQGRVKILDFGLARGTKDDSQLTQSGMIVGTPAYMSPEQANGHKVDHRTDLFSLGCVLYRLGTGQMPFKGETTMATLMAVVTEQPPPVHEVNPKIPRPFSDLVMQLLAKDPAKRPASARGVVEALQAIEREREQPATGAIDTFARSTPSEKTQTVSAASRRGFRWWPIALAGALVAGLFVLVAAAGIIYVQTDKGMLRIETADADVRVIVEQNGKVVTVLDPKTGREVKLRSGEYTLKLGEENRDVRIDKGAIQLRRGETVVANITKVAGPNVPANPAQSQARLLKRFAATDPTVVQDNIIREDGGWKLPVTQDRVIRLLELPNPGVQNGMITYRARMKSENVEGKAYLEMWCRFPGKGEFFSKGVDKPVRGTTDWAAYEIPFRLEKGQTPDLVRLNVNIEGKGTVWIKDVEVYFTPFESETPPNGKGVDEAWIKEVQKLPPDKQVEKVAAKLKELNPDFEGNVEPVIQSRRVAEVKFSADAVTDLTPIRALAQLRALHCRGSVTPDGKPAGKIADLSPLQGLPIRFLYCSGNPIKTLEPLRGMNLSQLSVNHTLITDIRPLEGMPLTMLDCGDTAVTDLSPVRKAPLQDLYVVFKGEQAEVLRNISTLKTINGKPVGEILKQAAIPNSALEPWIKDVQKLPADKQVEAVVARLKELNPGFDGKVMTRIEKGVVKNLKVSADTVTNLSPVRALPSLSVLECSGTPTYKGILSDLSPLQGLALTELKCGQTPIKDLSPLRGVPLTFLNAERTAIADLTPLKGMPLVSLNLQYTPVKDLSPLKDLPLKHLDCSHSQVVDLAPLRNVPLEMLSAPVQLPRDAELLRSMKTLKTINLKPVAEFWSDVDAKRLAFDFWVQTVQKSPAAVQVEAVAAKLKELNPGFDGKLGSPGRPGYKKEGNVVTELNFVTDHITDISPVVALKDLKSLTCSASALGKGILTDLSPLKDTQLTSLDCSWTQVSDLSPLKGLKLTSLRFANTKVADLSLLQGMPLTDLYCGYTPVADLSPLKGMKLTFLHCGGTKVADLSLLKGMPLTVLYCDFNPSRDADLLRAIKTLEKINHKPAAEFWKEVGEPKK